MFTRPTLSTVAISRQMVTWTNTRSQVTSFGIVKFTFALEAFAAVFTKVTFCDKTIHVGKTIKQIKSEQIKITY